MGPMSFSFKLSERRIIFITVDLLLLMFSVLLALGVWCYRGGKEFGIPFLVSQFHWFVFLPGLWLLINIATNAYRLESFGHIRKSMHTLFSAFVIIFLFYSLIYFFSPPQSLPRGVVLYHGSASFLLLMLWRSLYYRLALHPTFKRRVLILGAGDTGQMIGRMIEAQLDLHYELLGFVAEGSADAGRPTREKKEDGSSSDQPARSGRVLGTTRELVPLVKEHKISEIILAPESGLGDEAFRALLASQEQGVTIIPMPVLYEQMTGRVPSNHIGANWYVALPLNNPESEGFYPIFKRLLDIGVAFVGGTLFLLLFPIIYTAIRMDSEGPVFYSQVRIGKGGRFFRTWKLRTMIIDAEKTGEAVWAKSRDPRITRVGKWLRRARIDEFPQFLNILMGEMSAVGPRPERPEFVSELEKQIPFYRLRHGVKPGMAGWAMIHQDYAGTVEDVLVRLQYDLYYIKYQSIGLDLFILLQTFGKLLRLTGR